MKLHLLYYISRKKECTCIVGEDMKEGKLKKTKNDDDDDEEEEEEEEELQE